jgi:hypothetical protein
MPISKTNLGRRVAAKARTTVKGIMRGGGGVGRGGGGKE